MCIFIKRAVELRGGQRGNGNCTPSSPSPPTQIYCSPLLPYRPLAPPDFHTFCCLCNIDNIFFTYFFVGHNDWLWDGGVITQKQFLPVKSLHFGDTGTPLDGKEGR